MSHYQSEKITDMAKALLNVQRTVQPVARDAENPFAKSWYASLNSVMDTCRDALNENGIQLLKLVHRQAGTRDWVDTGTYRFRMSVAAGRTTLDKDALLEELTEIFNSEHMDGIDVDILLARCERIGSPFEKLTISPVN